MQQVVVTKIAGQAIGTADDADGLASLLVKPRIFAPTKVKKMPNCAAAPAAGWTDDAISGSKSVMVPMPRKIRRGIDTQLDA